MSLPLAEWQESLDQMETAVNTTMKTLARAEERWELAFAPSAGEGESPAALGRLEARLEEWEARLRAAEALTASVEQELTERISAVERWRALFATWEKLIKREESTSPAL